MVTGVAYIVGRREEMELGEIVNLRAGQEKARP